MSVENVVVVGSGPAGYTAAIYLARAETAKRVDVFAAALFHNMAVTEVSDLDLSYTPPLGSPWDAVQIATQRWDREHGPHTQKVFL